MGDTYFTQLCRDSGFDPFGTVLVIHNSAAEQHGCTSIANQIRVFL